MPIGVKVVTDRLSMVDTDVLIVPITVGGDLPTSVPPGVQKIIKERMRRMGFKGERGATELFVVSERSLKASFVGLVGLGRKDDGKNRMMEGMRRGIGQVMQSARQYGLRKVAVNFHGQKSGVATRDLAAASFEGAALAGYSFTEYSERLRRQHRQRGVRQLLLLVDADEQAVVRVAAKMTRQVMGGVELTRDLVNQPAEKMTPKTLVAEARALARKSFRIKAEVLDRHEAKQQGFSAFLAVAKGSNEEPYVIHLAYLPKEHRPETKKVWLVGKGITFDSGGLNIKPSEGMESMKTDMAGAATVLGLFSILDKLTVDIEVHGVIVACENMPSGEAYRPGDILTAKNGKTIEVLNTDAEGRIVLADALAYAAEHKPDAIVDLATLTGACVVALGSTVAGLMGNDDELRDKIMVAAWEAGEGMAQLPMPDEYKGFLESAVADVRNIPTVRGAGGAITAALFLSEFVDNVPWAHIDIAGPSYVERVCLPYYSKGATGYGVRMLAEFLRAFN
ncbi:MAG: leucyl aminopeptidase [bacterium]